MDYVFPNTDPATPFIYILLMDADLTSIFYKFATKADNKQTSDDLVGTRSRPKSRADDYSSKKEWRMGNALKLLLGNKLDYNCVEKIITDLSVERTSIDDNFRLILISIPADYFTFSVLQN